MSWQKSVYDDMTRAERMVFEFINALGIWCEYEYAVYIMDDKNRPRVWTPDFYLPELGIYIEVVGDGENPNYSWREGIYFKNKIPIIFIYPYEHESWEHYLVDRIKEMHQRRWEIIRNF